MKRHWLMPALVACVIAGAGCEKKTAETAGTMEKITVVNGAVPLYKFVIPEGDCFGNYTGFTATFLVDAQNYRSQARVRAYGAYPADLQVDLGDIVLLDFGSGSTDKNGPFLVSNLIGSNRNLSVVSDNAGANTWFTMYFPLYGVNHPNYDTANYPDKNASGEMYFALGLGTGSASESLTYYVKNVALVNEDGSRQIAAETDAFAKPAFAGYPANVAEISRVKTNKIDAVAANDESDDPLGYYKIRQIYPWLYSIYDPENVYCYLVVGNDRVLLYDTAYGIGSLPGAVKKITDKPVVCVLGHGHIDHANGAWQFDEAWLHEGDFELCRIHTSPDTRRDIVQGFAESGQPLPNGFDAEEYINAGAGNLKKLESGQIFDLGGLTVEAIPMEGHTAGSMGLLVREHRVLLDSDAASSHVWMFLPESLSVSIYIAMLERTIQLDFDTFFPGHSDAPMTKADFQKIINTARNAKVENSQPYASHPDLKPYIYVEEGMALVFSEEKRR